MGTGAGLLREVIRRGDRTAQVSQDPDSLTAFDEPSQAWLPPGSGSSSTPTLAAVLAAGNSATSLQAILQALQVAGMTGAATTSRYVGATTGGAPASGTWSNGDWCVDIATPAIYVYYSGAWHAPSGLATPTLSDVLTSGNSAATQTATLQALAIAGLTGATSASRYVGATTGGAPASGTFLTGDWCFSLGATPSIYACTAGGTPGTWAQIGGGGGGGGISTNSGVIGSEPGAPSTGDLYLCTDAPIIERYNGTSWDRFSRFGSPILTPPVLANFTWLNQTSGGGTGTAVSQNGGIVLTAPNVGGVNMRILQVAAPGSTPYSVVLHLLGYGMTANFGKVGISLYNSTSGKLGIWHMQHANTFNLHYSRDNSVTSWAGNMFDGQSWLPVFWLKVTNDGTNVTCYGSPDGSYWFQYYTETLASWLVSISHVGFFADAEGGGNTALLALHWAVG